MEKKIYVTIKNEFGWINAMYVAQIIAVQLTMKIKLPDLTEGRFEKRLKKIVRKKVLWDIPEKEFEEIWIIWSCVYDYDIELSIGNSGIGGHVQRTFMQIYNENKSCV